MHKNIKEYHLSLFFKLRMLTSVVTIKRDSKAERHITITVNACVIFGYHPLSIIYVKVYTLFPHFDVSQ